MNFCETYPDTCSTVSIAARKGDVKSLKKLIEYGRPVDVKDNRGWMPIHEAAYRGHVTCLKLLLQTDGINVEEKTFEMETPLLLASRAGHSQCVKALLEAGADSNSMTLEGLSPLWEACCIANEECVRLLLSAHAHVNHTTFTLDTPLHGLIQAKDHAPLVNLLLQHGADIRKRSENGLTPLFVASQFGRIDSISVLLLEAKSKGKYFLKRYVNTAANDKATPLYIATQEGHFRCVHLLLRCHANPGLGPTVDVRGKKYVMIPLLPAIRGKDLRCIRMLAPAIDKHPEKFPEFSDDTNPLIMGLQMGDLRVVNQLYSYATADYEPLDYITGTNDLHCAIAIAKKFHVVVPCDRPLGHLAFCISNNVGETVRDEMILFLLRLGVQLENRMPYLRNDMGISSNLFAYIAQRKYCLLRNCKERTPAVHTSVCKLWYKTSSNLPMKMCLQTDSTPLLTGERSFGRDAENIMFIAAQCDTLQHKCRLAVINQLLLMNRCKRETIQSLPAPKTLQSYLLYQDMGNKLGKKLIRHCQHLAEVEDYVNQVFAAMKFTPNPCG